MTSIADGAVCIQTSWASVPAPPSWFGELVLLTTHLRKHGMLDKIMKQVRFTRKRCGRYEVIDFLAVLFGDAISGLVGPGSVALPLGPFAFFGSVDGPTCGSAAGALSG